MMRYPTLLVVGLIGLVAACSAGADKDAGVDTPTPWASTPVRQETVPPTATPETGEETIPFREGRAGEFVITTDNKAHLDSLGCPPDRIGMGHISLEQTKELWVWPPRDSWGTEGAACVDQQGNVSPLEVVAGGQYRLGRNSRIGVWRGYFTDMPPVDIPMEQRGRAEGHGGGRAPSPSEHTHARIC